MRTFITNINEDIRKQSEQLSVGLASLQVSTIANPSTAPQATATPPITKALTVGAVVLGATALYSLNKDSATATTLSTLGAGALAYGAYKSNQMGQERTYQRERTESSNFNSQKQTLIAQCQREINSLDSSWERLMTAKQAEVRSYIDKLDVSDEERSAKRSKIYMYEVLKFSARELLELLYNAQDANSLKQAHLSIVSKVQGAIREAVSKQTAVYNSLI